jgi:hypothetical protein
MFVMFSLSYGGGGGATQKSSLATLLGLIMILPMVQIRVPNPRNNLYNSLRTLHNHKATCVLSVVTMKPPGTTDTNIALLDPKKYTDAHITTFTM